MNEFEWMMCREGRANRVQAMELMSFSALPRALVMDIEYWSISRLGSVCGIPTLYSVALNLLTFPWQTHDRQTDYPSMRGGRDPIPVIRPR